MQWLLHPLVGKSRRLDSWRLLLLSDDHHTCWTRGMAAAAWVHPSDADSLAAAAAAKRKRRRRTNRELREQAATTSWQCQQVGLEGGVLWAEEGTAVCPRPSADLHLTCRKCHARPHQCQGPHQSGRDGSARAGSNSAAGDGIGNEDAGSDDYDDLRLIFGQPRSRSEKQRFARAWRQWRLAEAKAEAKGAAATAAANQGSRGDDGGGGGSAGASAGPRWGQANWNWADFGQQGGKSGSNSGRGASSSSSYFDAWYEASSGAGSGSRRRRAAADSTGWGWHATWGEEDHSQWKRQQQQQYGDGSGTSGGTERSLELLGLGTAWLRGRCGRGLQRAYHAAAKRWHPDLHAGSGDSAAVAEAERRFKEVQSAFHSLKALVPPTSLL